MAFFQHEARQIVAVAGKEGPCKNQDQAKRKKRSRRLLLCSCTLRALHLSSTAINSWSHSIVPSHPNVQLFRSHYTPKYVVAAVRVCLTLKARFGSTIRTNRLSEPCDIWFFSVARLSNSACVFDYFVFDISIKPLQLRSPLLRFRFFFFDISVKRGRFPFFFFRHKRKGRTFSILFFST